MPMKYDKEDICLELVRKPDVIQKLHPVFLNDPTMKERKEKILKRMEANGCDVLVVYADLEHGSNFEYLTGFLPRFEEALLVLHKNGKAFLMLGNENMKLAPHSRIRATAIHVPYLSLPNQPMTEECLLEEAFQKAGITSGKMVGIAGWKRFTSHIKDNQKLYDLPYYLIEALKNVADHEKILNITDIFVGDLNGARITNNANEIAHYEFGASLASNLILKAMDAVEEGKSEMDIINAASMYGQPNSVITICATGERYQYANLYPTDKKVCKGDKFSLTAGFKGGLSSRAGYCVRTAAELKSENTDYMEVLAKPYFSCIATWLSEIHIGMSGDELYRLVEKAIPKCEYHWNLNPGHFIADEEWTASPVYEGSDSVLKSGMLLQADIIPSKEGYAGSCCECGIALADNELKRQLKEQCPDVWERMEKSRRFIKDELGIMLNEDVLPMSDTVGYYRPFLLDKGKALKVKTHY